MLVTVGVRAPTHMSWEGWFGFFHVCFRHHTSSSTSSSTSTDRCSPGRSLKMCLRTLAFRLLRGRVPNRLEILVSSQEGDGELQPLLLLRLQLPARLELLVRPSVRWLRLAGLSGGGKSLEKKQLSSEVLDALKGQGGLRSPNTLAWSLSSVMLLLSLKKRRPKRPAGGLMGEKEPIKGWGLLLLLLG